MTVDRSHRKLHAGRYSWMIFTDDMKNPQLVIRSGQPTSAHDRPIEAPSATAAFVEFADMLEHHGLIPTRVEFVADFKPHIGANFRAWVVTPDDRP